MRLSEDCLGHDLCGVSADSTGIVCENILDDCNNVDDTA